MAKKEERFEVIFRDGSSLKDDGVRQILVDKETGVNYLCWKSGYGAGITPLLDSEGKVIVTKSNSSLQNWPKRARRSSFSFFIIVSLWYNRDIKIGSCLMENIWRRE